MKKIDVWVVGKASLMVVMLAVVQAACVNVLPETPAPAKRAQDAPQDAMLRTWQPLETDKLHDPKNPGIQLLQQPAEALATLPGVPARSSTGSHPTAKPLINKDGNKVDWVKALQDGLISPRRTLSPPETGIPREELVMDMDIYLDIAGSMSIVRFPHLAHTIWLACSNCHPAIFVPQAGANPISMESILSGEQCGICHRAVSFPPTDCARCHSVSHSSPEAIKVKTEARAKAELHAKMEAEAQKRAQQSKEPVKKNEPVKGAKP